MNLVFIPTYNEKSNILKLIKEILKIKNTDILVVDDNSPDKTWALVQSVKNPRVHLIRRKGNRGRGLAGIEAYSFAVKNKYAFFVEMDGDFSHNPKDIPHILKYLETYDMVIGSRKVETGKDLERGVLRKILSLFSNCFSRVVLGIKVKDINSGFRGFKRKVLEEISISTLKSKGPSIVQEVLFRAFSKGFKIKEIPIEFRRRKGGSSKLRPIHLIKSFFSIIQMRLDSKN